MLVIYAEKGSLANDRSRASCRTALTDDVIAMLLNRGRSGLIKGFKSKAGKPFSAVLYIDQADRTIKFEFQNNT